METVTMPDIITRTATKLLEIIENFDIKNATLEEMEALAKVASIIEMLTRNYL